MKKKILSLLLAGCLLIPSFGSPVSASFTDIADPDTALAAGVLEGMGIVSGIREGVYSPDTVLTRAQFCVLIVHTLGKKDLVNTYAQKALFTDVKPGSWYTGYVNLAYSLNLLSGYGNGTFGPDDPITYGQAVTLLLRVLNYTSAEIGKVWPADYVSYAEALDLNEGLSLSANAAISRGQAAILLYNTLNTPAKGASAELYRSFADTASTKSAILLSTDAKSGTQDGLAMVCTLGSGSAVIEYFSQKNTLSDALIGCVGELMVTGAGKVVGFMPTGIRYDDVTIAQAKASGIVDPAGTLHRITGSAVTVIGEDLYSWNTTGYLQVNAQKEAVARLFYNNDGSVAYVYIGTGSAAASTQTAYAQTTSAEIEFVRALNITGSYSITKNGAPAASGDLTRYDTAYFDAASRTLRVSDHTITGYIQSASPALDGAQTVTVSGCTVPVVESAWDTLGKFKLGDKVTLLLTDNNKVAAAISALSSEMIGVLSLDRTSITLSGSGLVITDPELDMDANLGGTLVRCTVTMDGFNVSPYSTSVSGPIDLDRNTLGSYKLAPGFRVYEYSGSKSGRGFVYSLSGVQGSASSDFSEIDWTDTISATHIRAAHLNSAGQVDIILLHDVTGNSRQYGQYKAYKDSDGISSNVGGKVIHNNAATLTNANGTTKKFLSSFAVSGQSVSYYGVALSDNGNYQQATGVDKLMYASADSASFFMRDDIWYVSCKDQIFPVSEQVQVHFEPSDQWMSGYDGVRAALSSGLSIRVWYDDVPSSGGRIRVLNVK